MKRAGDTAWRGDLAWVLAITGGTFALSSALELHERLAAMFARHEAWQADELPLTLVALSLGLAWYAWRRLGEVAGLLLHNRELTQQLMTVQEGERLALARELHDELAQHCTAIRVEATCIQRSRSLGEAGLAARRVASSAELLQDGVRRLLRRLRPAELDALGLAAALESLCKDWSMRTGTACEFQCAGDLGGFGEAVDTAVFRVTQEALANVFRHADATHVRVALASTPSGLTLRVEDDGNGFASTRKTRGLGLMGAAERAAALGGVFRAFSTPGHGTRVQLELPDVRVLQAGSRV
ncbi:sensor histidine kinase [Variovorax ginsengisoli]|uniref:Oxygen sensor histidine kinase NreB n=1 Tax=Variovorax ginsengisoli TaxID=363844 RepID=A0ABT8SEZ9_9BURK|nr:ATP-binding protein [Variovorax ginsengisoli]MDN8618309.1 histidine kinase [Variovorax ginsengisoli]MDO1537479.1 histidine kinase [Variovorax ginsengisoli]